MGGGNRDSIRKKTPSGTPSSSYMPNKSPHQSQPILQCMIIMHVLLDELKHKHVLKEA